MMSLAPSELFFCAKIDFCILLFFLSLKHQISDQKDDFDCSPDIPRVLYYMEKRVQNTLVSYCYWILVLPFSLIFN